MSSQLKESLSAVIDGEADDFELKRVLDEVGRDPTMRLGWYRFHVIGALLRGEGRGRPLATDVALTRLWAAVDGAHADAAPAGELAGAGTRPWISRAGGVAVAAAVALAVVVGFGQLGQTERAGEAPLASTQSLPVMTMPIASVSDVDAIPAPDMAGDALAAAEGAGPVTAVSLRQFPSASDLTRTRAYFLHHAHQTALYRPPGPASFVKVAAFESR
jgi:sigma-E factor negative regulatory protein RseA